MSLTDETGGIKAGASERKASRACGAAILQLKLSKTRRSDHSTVIGISTTSFAAHQFYIPISKLISFIVIMEPSQFWIFNGKERLFIQNDVIVTEAEESCEC